MTPNPSLKWTATGKPLSPHSGRVIILCAGQAPSRCRPLSSNVRCHETLPLVQQRNSTRRTPSEYSHISKDTRFLAAAELPIVQKPDQAFPKGPTLAAAALAVSFRSCCKHGGVAEQTYSRGGGLAVPCLSICWRILGWQVYAHRKGTWHLTSHSSGLAIRSHGQPLTQETVSSNTGTSILLFIFNILELTNVALLGDF